LNNNIIKVKVLKIRVAEQFQNIDEAEVNEYFTRYDIIILNTKLIEDEINYWSILIHHQE
jgi:hypothetical protein